MDGKTIFGALAVIGGLVGYIPYIQSIARGQTRPHAFSWFVWTLILATAFGVQVSEGAGPGAWLTGIGSIACAAIFMIALVRGSRAYALTDWVALAMALSAFMLWRTANDPTLAAVFVTAADATSYVPTLRKTYFHPQQENIRAYIIWGLAAAVSIAALRSYSIATWLYPSSAVVMNPILITLAMRRRTTAVQTAR
ncbi:MAG: hypothetical protein HY421_02035 [Candidatus Kerfeldbacteria bacterium]|nr:hypothetical protein [Candidatus Kerfeldbacteria bacterium]